jgi:hypothetical protein
MLCHVLFLCIIAFGGGCSGPFVSWILFHLMVAKYGLQHRSKRISRRIMRTNSFLQSVQKQHSNAPALAVASVHIHFVWHDVVLHPFE